MQTVSETFAGTITVNRQMRLALPRMAMSLLIMSYLVADGVLLEDAMRRANYAIIDLMDSLGLLGDLPESNQISIFDR
ncbi:MAG: hypothetical protein BHW60_06475 [Sutterella sp. 54_7]|nr:MAG: hypothetical protein BHW60_06475 [Sutterella sp. 54_7]